MNRIIGTLSTEIEARLSPVVGTERIRRIALLDVPDHSNVGDQAIFLGEMAYLRKRLPGAELLVASARTYGPELDRAIDDCDIIFLHGGGNFGDIWRFHHDHRLDLLSRFYGKKIIQFPQSAYFESEDNIKNTARVIHNCRDLTLVFRDEISVDLARRHFDCPILLCPDMAFSLGPLSARSSKQDLVCLLRTDKEVKAEKSDEFFSIIEAAGKRYSTHDWLEDSRFARRLHTALRLVARQRRGAGIAARGARLFEAYAWARMKRGVELLSLGETVVTDRLHGMIISTLLGRRRIVFDSMDGKIGNFYRAWLTDDQDIHFCSSNDDLRRLLGGRKP